MSEDPFDKLDKWAKDPKNQRELDEFAKRVKRKRAEEGNDEVVLDKLEADWCSDEEVLFSRYEDKGIVIRDQGGCSDDSRIE